MELSLREAQLFRMLGGIFGPDRIVPQMSLLAVCGGELPARCTAPGLPAQGVLTGIARENRCLFTVVDEDDTPRLVVDFAAIDTDVVDPSRLDYQKIVEPVLSAAGIRFVAITGADFNEILSPRSSVDLVSFLQHHFDDISGAGGGCAGPDLPGDGQE